MDSTQSPPPTSDCSGSDADEQPYQRIPLHKHIRNRDWASVRRCVEGSPDLVRQRNRMGWSSLILAIYHQAPDWIVHTMLLQSRDNRDLLSMSVPNGNRLCLHFAARYADDLGTFQILVEGYRDALLIPSDDGVRALDRAKYYQKSSLIIDYLESATRLEQQRVELDKYNKNLQRTVWMSCERKRRLSSEEEDCLVMRVYRFTKERELLGLFGHLLSHVGTHSLPEGAIKSTS